MGMCYFLRVLDASRWPATLCFGIWENWSWYYRLTCWSYEGRKSLR